MAEQLERLARPSSELDSPGISSARGVNRNHFTLCLSVAALVLSLGGIAVDGFIFLKIDWKRKIAETELLQVQKSAAQMDVALKAQQIKTSAAQEQEALAAKLDHLAAAGNRDQDAARLFQQTRVDTRNAVSIEHILTDETIDALARSAQGAARRDPNLLGIHGDDPRREVVGVPPIGRMVPAVSRSRGNLGPPAWDK